MSGEMRGLPPRDDLVAMMDGYRKPVITPEMLELQRELNDTHTAWAGASGVHQAMLGPFHPLQIEAIAALKAKRHSEYIAQCRQRQQRLAKHKTCGRFDRRVR